uniref:Collagen, type VI, alpha 3 n=1 Tax=Oncorhynchus kisutch TaxID=8019 RepID=A0A8C7CLV6_ONCKI
CKGHNHDTNSKTNNSRKQLCPVFPLPMHNLIKLFFEHSHSLVESQAPRRDVVFLLDGSDDTRSGFPAMRDFVQRVVETLGVDENKDRVAVVQYSRDPAAQFYLNTYTTKGEILNTVRGLRHKGGRPLNTGAALQYVRDNVLTASSGSRRTEGVPQLLILLSGGRSFDNVDTPASALKELGVLIFGIGTRSSDSRELQRISHDPSYALSVSDFTDLPNIQQQLLSSVESVVIDVTKDVVFLVDGSDGTRNGFPAMRDFVQRVVGKLNVGGDKDRVSVVQYGRDQEVHFYLNTYTTKEDILNTVRSLRHRGGRPLNTGAALQYVRDNVLTASSGSRSQEGVPQMLILLSGGRSSDNVDIPASALKDSGVLIFGIGTRNSSREVQGIATDPSFSHNVNIFSVLFLKLLVDQSIARKDVVFLLDGSDGTRNGFPAMRDFVQRVVEKLTVEENRDRVSVVQYSRESEAHFYLNTYTTKEDVVDTVRGLRHKGGRPLNTGAALQYVRDNVFIASSGSRRLEGVPQILILLNGGRSFDNVDTPASALKELGVLVFGIGTRSSDSRELQKISYDPSYALSVSEFTDLPNVQQQLLSAMSLSCWIYFVPLQAPRRDVVFLLDGSDGTRSGFPAMRDFVQRVVETLGVDENKDRVAVVQYSRDPAAQFYLNTYTTKGEILNTVRGLRHKGGRPLNTGAALQYVRDNVLTASSGSRRTEGVPQLLILLSGGRSFDNVDTPASALKELGVLIFGIGTRSSDSRELQRISHDPSYALSVSDFTDLPNIQQQLLSSVEKDVVFLVDGSDGTRNGFPAMRDFVQRVVGKLNVGGDKDRVSVVQYGRDQEVHFYLNTYTTKEDILNTVRSLRHRGGRPLNTGAALQYVRDNVLTASSGRRPLNTGAALQYVRDNVFIASSGSRRLEGVPQILILLNGGRSFDNVDTPASALKELGVLVFGIGTRSSDSRELQKISYDPSYALSVSEFTDLPNVQQQLLSAMSTVIVKVTTMTPTSQAPRRDVVFLLDGSDDTRSGFPAMRDFVQRVVETLGVDENKDRVAVVQYSRDPAAQFYLNTYTTKGEILNTVRGLRHKGGRPLNTGAALQYVRDNVLTASSGSRRTEGVPQLLILLSGGRSFDNVDTPASALKELGVLIFGIGTRSSDSRELQRISHDPSYALSVSDFTDLPNIQQQLLSSVESVDVVFLVDGSDGTRNGFPAMRDFVQRVVGKLNVGGDKDRVSVVQYGRDQEVHFYLNTYTTKEDILNTVRSLRHRGGRPLNTGAALQYVRDNVLTASSGSRSQEGVPQMLILLSGGRSSDNVDIPASALKDSGVLIFGIGTRNSSREVQGIATDPSFSQSVSEFTDLPSVQEHNVNIFSVLFLKLLVDQSIARKDVVFLLDGSDGTRNGFPAMRDFVQRVVEKLTVEENRDRVSVVQYSRESEAHFYLNTYTTKEDVVNTVRGLKHKGGRPLNTGAALQYVRDNVFIASSGSRRLEGVPQILILLNGGRSFDNVDTPASALKELGVLVFGIGTRSSDSRELQKISYDPSYALSVSEFTDLPNVQQQLLSAMSTVIVKVTTMTPTVKPTILGKINMVLISSIFTLTSGFEVVETLGVDENKDRVAVVQYSRDPAAQFYLNTYTTKGEILNTVRGLRHKGGRPLNTGAALQYVRDNVLTASSGSRRTEGVPQLLILLSGGRSFDNVDTPASALKELGVLIFGIGTRSSDSRELQRISHDPSYALSVSDFTDLPNIQQQLLSSVESVVIDVTPESTTDLGTCHHC